MDFWNTCILKQDSRYSYEMGIMVQTTKLASQGIIQYRGEGY